MQEFIDLQVRLEDKVQKGEKVGEKKIFEYFFWDQQSVQRRVIVLFYFFIILFGDLNLKEKFV